MNIIVSLSFEKQYRVGTLTCTLTAQALLRSSGKLNAGPHLRLFHGVPVGELTEVGGEEDDVGDEDDADIVRHLGYVSPLAPHPRLTASATLHCRKLYLASVTGLAIAWTEVSMEGCPAVSSLTWMLLKVL